MRAIVVMVAKQPLPGFVKTRLCPPFSPAEAAEVYALFLQDTAQEMMRLACAAGRHSSAPADVAVAYTPDGAETAFKALMPSGMALFPQRGADLGQRLAGIFTRLFLEGYGQVHIINSDSPDLPCAVLREAVGRLAEPATDLVLGPSRDGGYYLVGLKRPVPDLFAGIPWSTERVLALTLQRAQRLGLASVLLPIWEDIDTCEDLLRFLARNRQRGGPHGAPGWRTLTWLRQRITKELPKVESVTGGRR